MLWSVWPDLPAFGRKASQFVDLLGYFTIKRSLCDDKAAEFSEKAIALLKKQNEILRNHANSNVYRSVISVTILRYRSQCMLTMCNSFVVGSKRLEI